VRQSRPAFRVEEFEYVEAGPGLTLLRLAGTWQAGDPPAEIALVAWSGGERIPLPALPAPAPDDGSWRSAYSASEELLSDPAVAFELEPATGGPIPLPTPVEHGSAEAEAVAEPESEPDPAQEAASIGSPTAGREPEGEARPRIFGRRRPAPATLDPSDMRTVLAAEREARQAAERTAAEERARAQRAEAVLHEELRSTVGKTEELIARIDDYEHSRVSFEEELDAVRRTHADLLAEAREEHALERRALRAELESAQRELAAAQDELDAANNHVDTLYEAHALELGAARSQRDAADERRATLERQLAAVQAAAETLEVRLENRESLIERAREEAAEATAESADLHAAVARLRDAIAVRARDAAASRSRFARSPEALDRSRDELRRDAERIAALERQAEALRDAIHSQLPYSLHASPLQEALPLGEQEQADEAQSDA
jgi:hypothetical protein